MKRKLVYIGLNAIIYTLYVALKIILASIIIYSLFYYFNMNYDNIFMALFTCFLLSLVILYLLFSLLNKLLIIAFSDYAT